jgi:septin family protein
MASIMERNGSYFIMVSTGYNSTGKQTLINSLGLFKRAGADASGKPQYELERKPTRTEELIMLF